MTSPHSFYNPNMPPRIAFVSTCRGRLQHLRQTLPKNIWDNVDYPNSIFVVLGYGDPELDDYMHTFELAMDSGQLAYYRMDRTGPFRMAHAKNVAHRCGILEGADILVNIDADNFTGAGFATYVAQQFSQHREERIFLWSRMIQGQFRRGISGRIAVTSNAFLLAGGYDEKFENWGPDDKDFNIRLQRLGYAPVEIDPKFLDAMSHNDKMRFKEYPHAAATKSHYHHFKKEDSCDAIANFGQVGCGVVFRNFDSDPISVAPIPTRIFGIGMHKTATTSLYLALRELGFDSAHWLSAKWAKTIWREMTSAGKSLTLEQHYAMSDLPFSLLMRRLDEAYPGSKFILTMLSEEAWIKAVELHWDPSHNPYRGGWDSDPFTNRVHSILYGRPDFDRETMLARYRHHNMDVLAYFAGRPDDLLVMNMSEGAGWKELCRFLGKPIPGGPYPHGNNDADLAARRHWIHATGEI